MDFLPGPEDGYRMDQWDGYPAARRRILDAIADGEGQRRQPQGDGRAGGSGVGAGASGAALALGAVVTRPPTGETVGHAWIVMFGTVIKLAFGVVLPLLILAALIEAYITPTLVINLL